MAAVKIRLQLVSVLWSPDLGKIADVGRLAIDVNCSLSTKQKGLADQGSLTSGIFTSMPLGLLGRQQP
jgi:hypothetical protein